MKQPELSIGPESENLTRLLHNDRSRYFPYTWDDEAIQEQYDGRGWDFGTGSPEYWKFSDRLLRPGGRVLDIGIGDGSSSIFFALHNMEVVGVDTSPLSMEAINDIVQETTDRLPELRMHAYKIDAINEDLPEGPFDTVVISHLIHLPSKEEAFRIFDKAMEVLKPGGHIWVRVAGKHSDGYERLLHEGSEDYMYNSEVWVENKDVIWQPCVCSGEWKVEPTVFFDPLDILNYFAQVGCKIVDSQTIETEGRMNIMFGKDFRPDTDYERGGMISLLAQKPIN